MNIYIGIDIGGTSIKIGFFDESKKLLHKNSIPTDISDCGQNILKSIAKKINICLKEYNYQKEQIKGIGFGIPGTVDNGIAKECVNLGWVNYNIEQEFLNLIDFKPSIKCDNDAAVAAIGEFDRHSYNDIVMITLGTGIGGSIIIDKKIHNGAHFASGEIGHMHIDMKHNFSCSCGLCGCLETIASAKGIVRLAQKYLGENPSSSLHQHPNLTAENIFHEVILNDYLAIRVVEEVAYNLAMTLSILAAIIDPEVFIIGGGMANAGELILEPIKNYYKVLAFKDLKNIPIILSTLGNDCGIYGAASLVLKKEM